MIDLPTLHASGGYAIFDDRFIPAPHGIKETA